MHILHLHSSFQPGGKELRSAKLINAFGPQLRHTIVSAEPEALGAAQAIDDEIDARFPDDFPALAGKPLPGRLRKLAYAMKPFDLILTYNWGAMDAVIAHTVFGKAFALPPLVHHEDGFNEDEADGLKPSRNWYRRIALARSSALVVPSHRLARIALDTWQQPPARVRQIANGIDVRAFAKRPKPDSLPRTIKHKGEKWIGTLAGLRKVKNLPRLVRAFSGLPDEWQLVIAGEGPEREAIRAEAIRLDVGHRVHLPGFIDDPAKAVGLFDIFALSSDSEQFPISVVEAMAAGIPVAAPNVGDVSSMLTEENRALVARADDEASLAGVLSALAGDAALRKRVGEANRRKALEEYDAEAMVDAYRAVYAEALGRESFP